MRTATDCKEAQYIWGSTWTRTSFGGIEIHVEQGAFTGPKQATAAGLGTFGGGQAKKPKQGGKLSYARASWEGVRVAVVCENYLDSQISKQNFVDIQRAIGRIVDELSEEGCIPRLVDSYWAKRVALMVSHDDMTKD
jgi:hypothetical protein